MAINQITAYPTITPGETNEVTGRLEWGVPFNNGEGWDYDERSGSYTMVDPNYQIPTELTLEDIKNQTGYSLDTTNPWNIRLVSGGAVDNTDPNAYYSQLGTELVNRAFGESAINNDATKYNNLIEGLKDVNPQAYYTAKIDMLSRQAGQNYMANEMGRMDTYQKQLQDLLPAAQQAGVTPDQINSLYESGFSTGGQTMQTILANQAEQGGGYLKPLVEGLKVVGPGALGMYGLDAALTAGLGAAYGAGTGMATTGLGSGLGGAAAMDGVLTAAGSLGSGALGGAGALSATQALPYTEAYDAFNLANQGLNSAAIEQNLAATGLDSFLSADMANLAAQGLSPEAIGQNFAYSYSPSELAGTGIQSLQTANDGLNVKDILSNANRVKTGVNTLAKLVGGGTSGATSGTTGTTGTGINTQQLASLLGSALPTQSAPGGLYRMNENPFNFGTQGQTVANTNMYDVSGTNPMANALRKKNYGIG